MTWFCSPSQDTAMFFFILFDSKLTFSIKENLCCTTDYKKSVLKL